MPDVVVLRRLMIGFHLVTWQTLRCGAALLPCAGALQPLGVIGDDLAKDFVEANGDLPIGIVRLEF